MHSSPTRGIWPALILFVLTPLIAEYLLGSLSIAQLGALPILCLLYGGGTVLIREAGRAGNRGWPTIVLLGFAYAIVEEGLATQSLFNPHYLHLSLLDYGYLPALGMGASWTVYVIGLHVIWSVCVPIAMVEALFPRTAETPWLGKIGHGVFTLLLLLGVLGVTAYTRKTEQFMASTTQLVLSGVAVLLFATLALRRRPSARDGQAPNSAAPNPWLVGVFALAAGSLFEVLESSRQMQLPWIAPVAVRLVLGLSAALLIAGWSRRQGWSPLHRFALGAGSLLVYCWWGYGVERSLHGSSGLLAHSVLVLLAVAMIGFAGLRVRGAHAPVTS